VLTLDEVKPGLALGRYECLLPIARGGMAAVWAARARGARGFQRFVAIKTMLPTLSSDANFETMFLDEARIVSRIRHPNVVEIVDLGEQDSLLYIVMEWIDGEPLSTLMRKSSEDGRLPLGIAARIMADACAGVHAAHELKDDEGRVVGLVHRDISPQNILVSYDGLVKLVDFGVAKATGMSSAETQAGHIKGKIAYMAPEQVTGHKVDRRTDVFACGIVLYQIATGKHPFRGEHEAATINNVLSRDVPPPRHYIPDCPPRLHQVLMRALQREPERRFQTAAEMGHELDEVARMDGKRVTSEAVASFIKKVAGPMGEERRAALKRAVAEVDQRPGQAAAMLASSADPVQPTPASGSVIITGQRSGMPIVLYPSAPGQEPSGTGSSAVSLGSAIAAPQRKSRVWLVAACGGAAVLLAGAAAAVSGIGASARDTQPMPPQVSSSPADPAPSAAAPVQPSASAAPSSTPPASSAPELAPSSSAPASGAGKRVPGKGPATGKGGGWVPPLTDPGF
jgi:serine/threonine-protein kinase